jgi:PhzF family phenazine biosynthesis protein
MPRSRLFAQVDVFSPTPYLGNPVAVVLDADDVNDQAMQRVARWTNLSETTFVLPPTIPEADYRLRIFTPGGELPFAGHPTLGSAHAWLEHGGTPLSAQRVVQEMRCRTGRRAPWPRDPVLRCPADAPRWGPRGAIPGADRQGVRHRR